MDGSWAIYIEDCMLQGSWAAVGVVDQEPDKARSIGRVRSVMGVRRTQSPAMGEK